MWRSLGLLMSVLITLDQIILQQPTLQHHWQSYYRFLMLVLVFRTPIQNTLLFLISPFKKCGGTY